MIEKDFDLDSALDSAPGLVLGPDFDSLQHCSFGVKLSRIQESNRPWVLMPSRSKMEEASRTPSAYSGSSSAALRTVL